eukprot:gene21624-22543_t
MQEVANRDRAGPVGGTAAVGDSPKELNGENGAQSSPAFVHRSLGTARPSAFPDDFASNQAAALIPTNISNFRGHGIGMYKRFVERRAEEALSDTPVVLIVGPRRAGKTTLVRKMGEAGRTYITLDDQTTLDAATSDPVGFIRGLDQAIIDEIQRAPDLLLAIKKTVDEAYRPGRFLLTGSANVLTLPRVADSLAGRMETIRMLPLARAEVIGKTPQFLERLFDGKLQGDEAAIVGDDLVKLVLDGGFPEAISRGSERRRQDWMRSYLTSILT